MKLCHDNYHAMGRLTCGSENVEMMLSASRASRKWFCCVQIIPAGMVWVGSRSALHVSENERSLPDLRLDRHRERRNVSSRIPFRIDSGDPNNSR